MHALTSLVDSEREPGYRVHAGEWESVAMSGLVCGADLVRAGCGRTGLYWSVVSCVDVELC